MRKDGQPDRSRVDFLWCKWSLERGNDSPSVQLKLIEVSTKAKEEWDHGNQGYVRRTVEAAMKALKF